ncbi:hypothetical protein Amsp01_096950 [Amycolatopsis sp. NBRC 101858]|nr:hypothetical protein Amsp01_096950 [Amycolatopsis sp. NBRC 101858]
MALSRQNLRVAPSTVVVHIGPEALLNLFSATRRERASRRVAGATRSPIPRNGGVPGPVAEGRRRRFAVAPRQ